MFPLSQCENIIFYNFKSEINMASTRQIVLLANGKIASIYATLLNLLGKSIHIRFLQKISFYHLKNYFIIYTILFYNTPNIPTFILPYYTLK